MKTSVDPQKAEGYSLAMQWLHQISIGKQISFILGVFFLWIIVASAWYVCGINNLCDAATQAAEEADIVYEITLSDSQLPVSMAYDRGGAAADIFIMLLIAFVLGTLLGRILSAPKALAVPPLFSLSSGTEKEALPERAGIPAHISEFTRKTAAQKPTVTITMPAPRPAVPMPVAKKENPNELKTTISRAAYPQDLPKDSAPIILGAAKPVFKPKFATPSPTPKPVTHFSPKPPLQPRAVTPSLAPIASSNTSTPQAASGERPKLRFNTSWNNPHRGDSNRNTK